MPKIVLSKHALERARSRGMELYAIEQLLLFPDHKKELGDGKFKFQKIVNKRNYQAVATWLAKENKWLIISVWVRGEEDKLPFAWLFISAPFRLAWWLLRSLWRIIAKIAGKK
jgi:hypothetical protein